MRFRKTGVLVYFETYLLNRIGKFFMIGSLGKHPCFRVTVKKYESYIYSLMKLKPTPGPVKSGGLDIVFALTFSSDVCPGESFWHNNINSY